ncbi:MAG: methyltransferase FkbM family [Hyphomicrobiales bacterium]|nr:methyltransferase FkbM family [Hyphomicrobiales bacterium]
MPSYDAAMKDAFGRFSPSGVTGRLIGFAESLPASWLGMRLSFLARNLATRLLRGGPLDVVRFGARMRLRPYGNTSEKRIAFTPHLFDAAERAALVEAARERPGFVFLDIGANIGGYALAVAAQAGAQAIVLAVEPQRDIFERLSFNARLNGFGNLKLVNCALTDQNGTVDLFLNQWQSGEASIRLVSDPDVPVLRVPAMTLLSLAESEGLTQIDALKISVEGAEEIVLLPFFQEAPKSLWPEIIVIEATALTESPALRLALGMHGYVEDMATRHHLLLRRTRKGPKPHAAVNVGTMPMASD